MSSFWQILTFKILTLNLGRWLPHLRFFSFWARILQDKGMQLLLPHTLRLVTTAFIWVPTAVCNIQKSKQAVSACCLRLYLEVGRGEQGWAEQLLCPWVSSAWGVWRFWAELCWYFHLGRQLLLLAMPSPVGLVNDWGVLRLLLSSVFSFQGP